MSGAGEKWSWRDAAWLLRECAAGWVVAAGAIAEFPNITGALIDRSWKSPDIGLVWGLNTLRVMHAAEQVAKR